MDEGRERRDSWRQGNRQLTSQERHERRRDDALFRTLRRIESLLTPPPMTRGGIWSATYRGSTHTGRAPMGASVQEGFGEDLTFQPTDGAGEPDNDATVTFAADDSTVIAVTDHGSTAAPFEVSYEVLDAANAGKVANVIATITDKDGKVTPASYAVTVLAGDATGGSFESAGVRPTAPAAPSA